MVDINRATDGVNLPPELAAEIWGTAVEASVVMQAARQIRLPGAGVTIHAVTGEPVAQWVGETESKPVDRHTIANKALTPYKLAVIEPFSMEFRRDLPGLYAELARRLPFSLARAFDSTVFGAVAAPGGNFDQLSDTATTVEISNLESLAAAYSTITAAGGDISAWLVDPALAGALVGINSSIAGFDLSAPSQVGAVFGAPVHKSRADFAVGIDGFAGDFQRDAVWGSVEGVQVSISDQATLVEGSGEDSTTINLWQQNMFAVRAEIEVGFRVTDEDRFAALSVAPEDPPGGD